VAWPRDDAKLDRVRAAMDEQGVDAIVARAPDNVLYLTNFWGMKGYDAVLFPREGTPTLFCLEASADDAARTAWTSDVRLVDGYLADDPRPPGMRTLELAAAAAREHGTVGLELSLGTQATDRMVGEPTTFTKGWFDAFGDAVDATPILNGSRAIKTDQEIERMQLANDIAAAAMDHVCGVIRPGMTEAQIASEWLGFVHGDGTGWAGQVELALGFSLVWAGPGIKTFTATSNRPVLEGEPTLFEIWVCADGYWCDHTKNVVVGELTEPYRELAAGLTEVYDAAVAHCQPGAGLAELDRLVREGVERIGYHGQPSHPICHGVGARAHEPPYAHQAGGGEVEAGMVLAIEPGCYWRGGGGLRLEDNWLITEDGPEKLCAFPDGIVRADA
jgi:Xaa-Pro aminopeptidase